MTIFDRFSLKGRVALVTGGGRGLGLEIAKALCEAGAHVVITGRTAATLDTAVSALTQAGGSASTAAFDIADRHAQRETLALIEQQHGRLDILVNNVGARDRRPLSAFDDDTAIDLIQTDLISALTLSRDAAAIMMKNGHGRLISITSINGQVSMPGDGIYPVAKQGLTGLMRAMAVEFGPHGDHQQCNRTRLVCHRDQRGNGRRRGPDALRAPAHPGPTLGPPARNRRRRPVPGQRRRIVRQRPCADGGWRHDGQDVRGALSLLPCGEKCRAHARR